MAVRYAEVEDVATLWRPVPADTPLEAQIEMLLDIASAKLRRAVSTLDARLLLGAEADLALLAKAAIVTMILRVLRNPAAFSQSTTGPFSVTFNLDAASGLLEVLPGDLTDLWPTTGNSSAIGTGFTQITRF